MSRIKRGGRPKVIELARKQNIYLSADVDAHVKNIADEKFLSFSAALRFALREHMAMTKNIGRAAVLSTDAIGAST